MSTENLQNMQHFSNKYGTLFGGWLGMKFMVSTSDPALIKIALNSDACIDKSDFFTALEYLMKNGILLARGYKY